MLTAIVVTAQIQPASKTARTDAFPSVAKLGAPVPYTRDTEIYGEGEEAKYFYQVVSGAVRTYKILNDGRRQIGAFYLAGDVFGLKADDEHEMSAEAISCRCRGRTLQTISVSQSRPYRARLHSLRGRLRSRCPARAVCNSPMLVGFADWTPSRSAVRHIFSIAQVTHGVRSIDGGTRPRSSYTRRTHCFPPSLPTCSAREPSVSRQARVRYPRTMPRGPSPISSLRRPKQSCACS
jgi:hypothetical protein